MGGEWKNDSDDLDTEGKLVLGSAEQHALSPEKYPNRNLSHVEEAMACCPYDVHDFDLDQEIKRNFDFDQRSHQNAYSAAVAMAIRSGVPIVAVFGSHKLPEMRDVLENLIAELKKVIDPVRKPVYIYIDIDLIDGQSQPALKKYIDETIRARNNACTIVFPIEPGKYGIPEIRTVVWGGPKGLAMALRESLHQAQAKMDQGKNAFYTTYQP